MEWGERMRQELTLSVRVQDASSAMTDRKGPISFWDRVLQEVVEAEGQSLVFQEALPAMFQAYQVPSEKVSYQLL